jgi:hypothetical protein
LHYAAEVLGKRTVKMMEEHERGDDKDKLNLDLVTSRLQVHAKNIQYLVSAYPAATRMEDCQGNLPLHILLRAGYRDHGTSDNAVWQTPDALLHAQLEISVAYREAANIADSNGFHTT